ncbi:MAG: AAA family ATPase [Gemmatimonadales bacterium]|nr:AAA family ATPase [Gemmatimonadales bacterium]
MERERAGLARRLEEARRAVEERERARLLAGARGSSARDRLGTLEEEVRRNERRRADLRERVAEARSALKEGQSLAAEGAAAAAQLELRAEALAETARTAARERAAAREALDEAGRERERWKLELGVREVRARDRTEELERRRPALDALAAQEHGLRMEVESASEREAQAGRTLEEARDRLRAARDAASSADAALRRARGETADLEGRLAAARARASSLGSLVGSSALLPEAVAQLLEDRSAIPGLHGALSEFMEASAPWASAVESQLGPYLHGVVVRDWSAVRAVEAWLEERGVEEGVLVLPLDPGPLPGPPETEAPLLRHVDAKGAGAVWVRALLAGVEVPSDGELAPRPHAWVDPEGRRQDRWGGVYVGGAASEGLLSRRAELQALREEAAVLEEDRERSREAMKELGAAASEALARANALERSASDAESARREAEADRTSTEARLVRLDRERSELAGRIEQLEAFGEDEVSLSAADDARAGELDRRVSERSATYEEAQEKADDARAAAEAGKAELHRAELAQARREAEVENRRGVESRLAEAAEDAEERSRALAREVDGLHALIAETRAESEELEASIGAALETRTRREANLAELERRIAERRGRLDTLESELSEARRLERERVDARHRLELEILELEGRESAIQGRVEAEWDAPLPELRERVDPVDDAEPAEWEPELERVRRSIARIGPVNLLAQREYEEEQKRLEFLTGQRDDLTRARDDLRTSIRRINRQATSALLETFEQVRTNFHRTFDTLFEGGQCDLRFEHPDDALDSPIEISASPRGKKTQRIHLLSGGERALTALALLFAIYLAKPSPFCLLDEVDAPLDETNILRFVRMLKEFKEETQFIVITHNPRTIENADWIYGVTMQEAGVSSIVGVEFNSATQVA